MTSEQIREAVRAVVSSMVGRRVEDSELLISSGLIDSLAILKLITKLENELCLHLPAALLQPDDFETVDIAVETVQRVGKPR